MCCVDFVCSGTVFVMHWVTSAKQTGLAENIKKFPGLVVSSRPVHYEDKDELLFEAGGSLSCFQDSAAKNSLCMDACMPGYTVGAFLYFGPGEVWMWFGS